MSRINAQGYSLKFLCRLLSIALTALACWWLYVFTLTNYREHLAPYMVASAIAVIVFSTFLWRMNSWAIRLLYLLVLTGTIGAIWLQIQAGVFNWALSTYFALGTVLLAILLGPALKVIPMTGSNTSESNKQK